MLGTFLNVAAILIGGILGLTVAKNLSAANQSFIRIGLGCFTVFVGLRTTWTALPSSFGAVLRQFVIVLVALVIGNIIGKLAGLQKTLNRLGQYAKDRFTKASPTGPNRVGEGFVTCSLLFCVGPMAVLGALQDGLTGRIETLAIKSAMDGLATMAFAKTFGWGVMLASIPVLLYQGTITIAAHAIQPLIANQAVLDSISATGGLLICCISLVILELKKVPLADYLPSLAIAPLLTWVWGS
jgi:uncharacterized protein